jgi:hypothetical protein
MTRRHTNRPTAEDCGDRFEVKRHQPTEMAWDYCGIYGRSRMALPVAIFDRLARWLEAYVGSLEEPRLRALLAEIRAQQFQPVRQGILHTQRGDVWALLRLCAALAPRNRLCHNPPHASPPRRESIHVCRTARRIGQNFARD